MRDNDACIIQAFDLHKLNDRGNTLWRLVGRRRMDRKGCSIRDDDTKLKEEEIFDGLKERIKTDLTGKLPTDET